MQKRSRHLKRLPLREGNGRPAHPVADEIKGDTQADKPRSGNGHLQPDANAENQGEARPPSSLFRFTAVLVAAIAHTPNRFGFSPHIDGVARTHNATTDQPALFWATRVRAYR